MQATDIALALRYLHERDTPVVHLNVRSRNVLIDNDRRGVLGGFGFSRVIYLLFTVLGVDCFQNRNSHPQGAKRLIPLAYPEM